MLMIYSPFFNRTSPPHGMDNEDLEFGCCSSGNLLAPPPSVECSPPAVKAGLRAEQCGRHRRGFLSMQPAGEALPCIVTLTARHAT